MVGEINYDSLREKLYSKKENLVQEEIQTKKKQEPSRYRLIKERLKGENSDWKGISPDIKTDTIVYFLGAPKDLYDGTLNLPNKGNSPAYDFSRYGTKRVVKDIMRSFSKKDVEEAIINGLNELDSKGIQKTINYGNTYRKKQITKYSNIDSRVTEFGESFDNIKKLESILSHRRFLKKHGISSSEIKKYEETFKKRVGRVLNNAVEFAINKETQEITEQMLKYAKKEGLINYKPRGLEKTLGIVSIASVLAGIFLLSPNLTGNVVGNLTMNSTNIFGGLLFILGLTGTFLTLKR